MNVAVIGASDKPDRYSNMAVKLLKQNGHAVYPVHRRIQSIEGLKVYPAIEAITDPVDTVTMYVGAETSEGMTDAIIGKNPRRIIFNPGAENPHLAEKARAKGIKTLEACTLVMLNTNQF